MRRKRLPGEFGLPWDGECAKGRAGRIRAVAGALGRSEVSGYGRIMLFGALLAAGAGVAVVRAQTVLGDPRDAARIFASNCSACHKSPRGLAKSGQIAGFLRQHYTTGPEMSAAMAAYLVAAGAAPQEKKGAATADGTAAAKTKGKKQEQLSAAQPAGERTSDPTHQHTLRGKQQRPGQSEDETSAPRAVPPAQPAAEETKQAAASASLSAAPTAVAVPPEPAVMVLDIPLPPLPEGPPADLVQSVFSSSPLP